MDFKDLNEKSKSLNLARGELELYLIKPSITLVFGIGGNIGFTSTSDYNFLPALMGMSFGLLYVISIPFQSIIEIDDGEISGILQYISIWNLAIGNYKIQKMFNQFDLDIGPVIYVSTSLFNLGLGIPVDFT